MSEWDALSTVAGVVGAAFTAYGKYQEVFGPALQEINWKEYIEASERRIITAAKVAQFKDYTRRLQNLSKFWSETCVDFLREFPISPENIEAFNIKIGIDSLRGYINELGNIILYFGGDEAPGDYGTYGALLTAHSLNYILLTVAETYFVAVEKRRSAGKEISRAIATGIRDVRAWPGKYVLERSSHMSVEVEEKISGGGGWTGKAGEKRTTGWYIVHDTANDPVVGTFEGQRFYREWPKKDEMVTERYHRSKLATTLIPDILKKWEDLHAKALNAEPVEFDPGPWWHRISNFSPPYLAIDVINDPVTIKSDAQLHLVPKADNPGQFWQIRPSRLTPGTWNLCTLFLGTEMCLDVYGNDKRRPHLAPASNSSGQQWRITSRGDGTWSFTNSYSGPDLLLERGVINTDGSARLSLNEKQEASLTQRWWFLGIRLITEKEFLAH
ncbi:hypothetical protein CNMCM8927_003591 [Aspergillus lentulus]|uniref:Ricin B lectin domain-containing protein n=1 Tax=Aspergillus lentulus TaxID=293939 RepID=A0AAN5YSV7_ASPLE|nr:hypothetical protein CNMCM8927_003591 [Aspergillus lentulus]